MKRKTLLVAMIFGVALAVINQTAWAGSSETHLQFQNQAVNRNRPGIAEQCVYFDPGTVHVGHFMDRGSVELVVAPLRTLSRFDSRDEATRSLKIIEHFRINELCMSANSKLSYMLVSGNAARGKLPGEKYLVFDPYLLKAERVGNEWKLVKGKSAIFGFGSDEGAARQALQVIRYYGFNAKCSIGGDKGFVFLFKSPVSPRMEKKPYLEAKAVPEP
jgi:hypothetical protein